MEAPEVEMLARDVELLGDSFCTSVLFSTHSCADATFITNVNAEIGKNKRLLCDALGGRLIVDQKAKCMQPRSFIVMVD